MPAPWDSGATTSEASSSVVPGIEVAQVVGDDERHLPMRQHRRLGPPVVPEVKKNQQGSSCSTAASRSARRPCGLSIRAADVGVAETGRRRRQG